MSCQSVGVISNMQGRMSSCQVRSLKNIHEIVVKCSVGERLPTKVGVRIDGVA